MDLLLLLLLLLFLSSLWDIVNIMMLDVVRPLSSEPTNQAKLLLSLTYSGSSTISISISISITRFEADTGKNILWILFHRIQ
jgi:hypothetical protein